VRNGKVYFDGDPQDDALAEHLCRCLKGAVEDYMPVIKFLEKLKTNPNEHSREQLWPWLKKLNFSITTEGDILGYKGFRTKYDGTLTSRNKGTAIVDGEEVTGVIPYPIGGTVEMPRSDVQHDPSVGCSTGLHVGTFAYAKDFAGRDPLGAVIVNPRDVVSVPTEHNEAKMRCSRLKVLAKVSEPYREPIVEVKA
jgi:hypothetical protein